MGESQQKSEQKNGNLNKRKVVVFESIGEIVGTDLMYLSSVL